MQSNVHFTAIESTVYQPERSERPPDSPIWHSQEIIVHQTHVGRIMGKNGVRVKNIKRETAAQIDVYHAVRNLDGQVPVVVRAQTQQQVHKAMSMILQLLASKAGEQRRNDAGGAGRFTLADTGSSTPEYGSCRPLASPAPPMYGLFNTGPKPDAGEVSAEIYLAAGEAGKFIGMRGSTAKQIQAKTGTLIDVLHYRSTPDGLWVPVVIRGQHGFQVEEAKRMVLQLMDTKPAVNCATPTGSADDLHGRPNSPFVADEPAPPRMTVMPRVFNKLPIPAEKLGTIKALLRELENRFSSIKLKLQETAPPKTSSLVITGPSDKVAAAKSELEQLLLFRDSSDVGSAASRPPSSLSAFLDQMQEGLMEGVLEGLQIGITKANVSSFPMCEKCGIRKREMLFECGHLTHCFECTDAIPRCNRCGKISTETRRLLH